MEMEMEMEIRIHNFPKQLIGDESSWLALARKIIEAMNFEPESVQIIFTDDPTLRAMHEQFLNDPTETDVITFDLGEEGSVEGEIYISIDRARAQAKEYGVSPEEEVLRLIVHGLLHLQGYDDLEEEARKEMKEQENLYVEKFAPKLNNGKFWRS